LDVEEIDGPLRDAPLQRRRGAEPEAAEPERLANAGDGDIARGGTGIANIDLPELEDAKARGLAGQVDAQHFDQAADEARTHHRLRSGDRIDDADGVGIAREVALPAFIDETKADRLL